MIVSVLLHPPASLQFLVFTIHSLVTPMVADASSPVYKGTPQAPVKSIEISNHKELSFTTSQSLPFKTNYCTNQSWFFFPYKKYFQASVRLFSSYTNKFIHYLPAVRGMVSLGLTRW